MMFQTCKGKGRFARYSGRGRVARFFYALFLLQETVN